MYGDLCNIILQYNILLVNITLIEMKYSAAPIWGFPVATSTQPLHILYNQGWF